jgi:hypothetical protein
MRWPRLVRLMIKPDRHECVSGDRNRAVASGALAIARPNWEQNHCAESWRGVIHGALLLVFFVLGVFVWMRWNFSARPITDWQPVLALADAALERGDLYYAKSLYVQAGRLSTGRDDWAGLLAAACGMQKLERQRGRRSETTALLLKAMAAAKARQSRSGLAAVAQAFTALGQDQVAAMVLAQSGQGWVEESANPAGGVALDCWQRRD